MRSVHVRVNGVNPMHITTKELVPSLWPDVEQLFGSNGACGGCWCQAWRIEKGERWDDVKGAVAKRRLRKGIRDRTTMGVVAFDGKTPIGWCTFGPRDIFPRLNRARTLRCDDALLVWSIPCFFVIRGYRERGVASMMLKHAIAIMKKKRATTIEGYPSKPGTDGRYIAAFSWTGTFALFDRAGFVVAGNADGSKRRVRKQLR